MIAELKGQLVAVVRATSVEEGIALCTALASSGIRHLEIAVNLAHGPAILAALRRRTDLTLGAGSVLDERQARAACDAGASFLVSPGFSAEVRRTALDRGVLYIPGVLTPTEIMSARAAGCELLKLFPAGAFGANYLADLAGPFPGLMLMPTGGVNLANLGDFFRAGAHCCGIGGSLLRGDLIRARDFAGLGKLAADFVAERERWQANVR